MYFSLGCEAIKLIVVTISCIAMLNASVQSIIIHNVVMLTVVIMLYYKSFSCVVCHLFIVSLC